MKNNIVPVAPETLKIEDKSVENMQGWITYFNNLSSRIILILPSDPKFDLDQYKSKTMEQINLDKDQKIIGWPELKDIAFFVSFDSANPGHEKEFLLNNSYLFCFKDLKPIAFGLDYFEWNGGDEDNTLSESYSLENFSENCLTWGFIANIIKKELERISISVPQPPPYRKVSEYY